MTGNVIHVFGWPETQRRINDMYSGEVGYTVPWAYDISTACLNTAFVISPQKFGTATLRVECVVPGEYIVGSKQPHQRF